jgi:hypothetical protein
VPDGGGSPTPSPGHIPPRKDHTAFKRNNT